MVLLATDDGECPVELFHEYHANHLMGECHLRKREFFVCPFVDVGRESVGSADDEYELPVYGLLFLLHPFCQFDAPQFFAVFVEQYHIVAVLQLFQDEFAFLPFLHFLRQGFGVLEFGDGDDVERAVVAYPSCIVADDGSELVAYCLAHL